MPAPFRFRLTTFKDRLRPLSLLAACLLVLGLGVAAVAPAALAASANLLSNGDFATGSTSGWTCSAGDTVVTSPTYSTARPSRWPARPPAATTRSAARSSASSRLPPTR